MYKTDECGIWKVEENVQILVEPSEKFLQERELREQQRIEKEMMDNLKPSDKEVSEAETQLTVLELLLKLEVI